MKRSVSGTSLSEESTTGTGTEVSDFGLLDWWHGNDDRHNTGDPHPDSHSEEGNEPTDEEFRRKSTRLSSVNLLHAPPSMAYGPNRSSRPPLCPPVSDYLKQLCARNAKIIPKFVYCMNVETSSKNKSRDNDRDQCCKCIGDCAQNPSCPCIARYIAYNIHKLLLVAIFHIFLTYVLNIYYTLYNL